MSWPLYKETKMNTALPGSEPIRLKPATFTLFICIWAYKEELKQRKLMVKNYSVQLCKNNTW